MNLELLPEGGDLPAAVTATLVLPRHSPALCAFSRRGNYLALGGGEGQLAVWDVEAARAPARVLGPPHAGKVVALAWAPGGAALLSAGDHRVCVWDLARGARTRTLRFPAPVAAACFHPRDASSLLVCAATYVPCLVELGGQGDAPRLLPIFVEGEPPEGAGGPVGGLGDEHGAPDMTTYVACFSRSGVWIYVGNSKGLLAVVSTADRKVVFQTRLENRVGVKGIAVGRRGRHLLVNATDKVIRAMPLDAKTGIPEVAATVKYRDNVEGCQWTTCCFSPGEDYVVGASQSRGSHELYIWDRAMGNLVRKLNGPPEGGTLRDLAWHPFRPIIATVSQEDRVYIWANSTEENWSAFAPDFREVEENTDYREMEDEFDIVADDALTRQKIHGLVEPPEEFPDITTIAPVAALEDSGSELADSADGEEPAEKLQSPRKRRKTSSLAPNLAPLDDYLSDGAEEDVVEE
ncbi:WD40-repeat-containing domain protein [Hyaloraphidium curvatum]|nr:WD40-repeat-containing domain protein [Hyaloraphidium curvatum]